MRSSKLSGATVAADPFHGVMDMDGGMGWRMVFGMIWMVLFWGAIIWAIVWGVSRVSGHDHSSSESPLDIARRRYANGEITRDQFEQLRHDLG